ncbi:LbtU family siderophore porin [Legionella dresdenensis]|uniref:LbtU family siderophore porin n=1 Tax=Legionella dresdenensis TaxID=450200 RepID=A0ABV8CHZ6_9GAMM
MKHKALILALASISLPLFAASDNGELQQEIKRLQKQTAALQQQLNRLQNQVVSHKSPVVRQKKQAAKQPSKPAVQKPAAPTQKNTIRTQKPASVATGAKPRTGSQAVHASSLTVNTFNGHPESLEFYPTALMAEDHVVTYIAGTPIVTVPYLGARPAFDGSDYIVNISSINRDIRLMQQRRRLYDAYERIGYPAPNVPIIAISGKAEPVASFHQPYVGNSGGDLTLGSSEVDVMAALNENVEGFIGIAYDESPPANGGQRLANSAFNLNLGFVNIGNLDKTPFYFTAGQLYAPFGRYSSSMISSPVTLDMARTKTRPFILGYKSQGSSGPYAALYGFKSDTTLGDTAIGGFNWGYVFSSNDISGEIGAGVISTLADAQGMQYTGSPAFTTFGGFASPTNGSEAVGKVPGLNIHGNISIDRYSLTAEWVGASKAFNPQALSYNGRGAKPQAAQLEAGVTFMAFARPASLGATYQWSKETLALNLPHKSVGGVFNISIWKDTVESIEYRHDTDFNQLQYANGASAPGFTNQNTVGTGKGSDTVIAQIGVYF